MTIEADPGTSITVSVNSSSPSALENWAFGGTGSSAITSVTFAAGTNPTYVYYELIQETVAYHVGGAGNPISASLAPELTYQGLPAAASATPATVTSEQVLGTTSSVVYAVAGTIADVQTIPGLSGERWAASAENWTISGPDSIANPILLYQQYEVSISYSIEGGGTPSQIPVFNSTALGRPLTVSLSNSETTGWFDAGSAYSFTNSLSGSTPNERWFYGQGVAICPVGFQNCGPIINSPNQEVSAGYVHQYYVDLALNDANGGIISGTYSGVTQGGGFQNSVSPGPAWMDAGSSLNVTATATANWKFEGWNAVCVGGALGCNFSPTIDITVTGPLNENATFYPQFIISAGRGANIAFSYGSQAGTVQAGTSKTLYVPPSSNVTLRATPASFLYSFGSWIVTGLVTNSRPQLSLVVDSPIAVTGTTTYNYPAIIGASAAVALVIFSGSLWIRGRRKRANEWAFPPT